MMVETKFYCKKGDSDSSANRVVASGPAAYF